MNDILKMIEYTKDMNLLYVEDDEDTNITTMFLLEELFQNIIVAHNGQDGLDKFKDNKIDLILTDISMPKLSGLEMTKKIRETNKDVPILVISAYNESKYLDSSVNVGVDGYIFKPMDISQFNKVLTNVIENIKLKDEVK